MTISCKFCDWFLDFPPNNLPERDAACYEAGRHFEQNHAGMREAMHEFDQRLEEYVLLTDPREEVER